MRRVPRQDPGSSSGSGKLGGGRSIDAWLAYQQHLIIVTWQERHRRPSTAELEELVEFSRRLMSLNATGQRWMGFLEACALGAIPGCDPQQMPPLAQG